MFRRARSATQAGGAIYLDAGTRATISKTLFMNNSAGFGGAINAAGQNTDVLVTRCSAAYNMGGWGSFAHVEKRATMTIENSTLNNNTATNAGTLGSPDGNFNLRNVTIVNNRNTNGGAAGIFINGQPSSLQMSNTLVVQNRDINNVESDCDCENPGTTLSSVGGNIVGSPSSNCTAALQRSSDKLNVNAMLDPVGAIDRGDGTPSIMFMAGSPGIDGGNDASCPDVDQGGDRRPQGVRCDVGALEHP
jgi:predicted outer membrane repeat protein